MKKIEIVVVKDNKEKLNYLKQLENKVKRGSDISKTIILTPDLFAKLFSAKRVLMLKELGYINYGSIQELAEHLNRPYEVIHRDLKLFEHYGIVKLDKNNSYVVPTLCGRVSSTII